MKKIVLTILVAAGCIAHAQVIIGDAEGTATDKTSVLLEFAKNQNKGIIVPYVRTLPTGSALVGGSIILDARTPSAAKMRYYNAVNSTWVDLSGDAASGDLTSLMNTSQPTEAQAPEVAASKAIIGAASSSADGVLVLESNNKAMVLPIVGLIDDAGIMRVNVPNPSPGMMVYVNTPGAKRLAVFNGAKWSFWKP